jgi:hypothetical protein
MDARTGKDTTWGALPPMGLSPTARRCEADLMHPDAEEEADDRCRLLQIYM